MWQLVVYSSSTGESFGFDLVFEPHTSTAFDIDIKHESCSRMRDHEMICQHARYVRCLLISHRTAIVLYCCCTDEIL